MVFEREIADIATAEELLERAVRRAKRISLRDVKTPRPRKGEGRENARRRVLCEAKVNCVSDYIAPRLRGYVRSFPSFDGIHPFYTELLDSVYPIEDVKRALSRVDWASKKIRELAARYSKRINAGGDDPNRLRKEFYGRVASIMGRISGALDLLIKTRNLLKTLPVIDTEIPIIVVAGAPNVGKSTLVSASSTAKIKVATYPFTTKDVKVGIVALGNARIQIVDTPGLFDRTEEEMNKIERRASAAIRYADEILFLLDPTETCGYPLDMQLSVLANVRERFAGDVPVTVLCVKSDLYTEFPVDIEPCGCSHILSALTGEGMDNLLEYLKRRYG